MQLSGICIVVLFHNFKGITRSYKKDVLSFQLKYFTTVNYRESKMVVLSEFQEGKAEIYMLTI